MSGRLVTCPSGHRVKPVPVVFGDPLPETIARARRGEVRLGGCQQAPVPVARPAVAHPPDADVSLYAADSWLTREEYDCSWAGEPPGYQIVGNDYYGRNEKILKPDGTMCLAEDVLGWYQITKRYYDRYRKPVMYTETNVFDADEAPTWLWKQWVNVLWMRADGVPVLGFTWYSLIDQIDWDVELAQQRGIINPRPLRPRATSAAGWRQRIGTSFGRFGRITIVPHGELFEVTDEAAGSGWRSRRALAGRTGRASGPGAMPPSGGRPHLHRRIQPAGGGHPRCPRPAMRGAARG